MSEECPQLSRKSRISGKLFQALDNARSMQMEVPEFLWHCSRDSEIIDFCFGSFTKFDVMLEECPELSRKSLSGNLFQALDNAKSVQMAVPEFLWHCSRDSEVIGSDILKVLLSLSLFRRNAQNYRQNDRLLDTCFSFNNLIVGNSLRYFNNLQRNSLVAKTNMKVFRICV